MVKGFEKHSRKTRKEAFLSRMERLVPVFVLLALICLFVQRFPI
jgi:hypothetical protein